MSSTPETPFELFGGRELEIIELTRDWLEPQYGEDAWKSICAELPIAYRQRSITKALVSLCVFHAEKTPSFWMYPSGIFNCYGCSSNGDMTDFIYEPKPQYPDAHPSKLLKLFGQPPKALQEADVIFERLGPKPTTGQLAFEEWRRDNPDEEPF
ncbi:MAG TPA: CHC2 zinc finger domain-containing protein [Candidatus Saccharimonadales bacterium]|nr:CHC2 zinc finger domain-containing protein [Candidatus Saccharimonadales bacterium]